MLSTQEEMTYFDTAHLTMATFQYPRTNPNNFLYSIRHTFGITGAVVVPGSVAPYAKLDELLKQLAQLERERKARDIKIQESYDNRQRTLDAIANTDTFMTEKIPAP